MKSGPLIYCTLLFGLITNITRQNALLELIIVVIMVIKSLVIDVVSSIILMISYNLGFRLNQKFANQNVYINWLSLIIVIIIIETKTALGLVLWLLLYGCIFDPLLTKTNTDESQFPPWSPVTYHISKQTLNVILIASSSPSWSMSLSNDFQ